jgi:hypothetical protein
VKPVRDVLGLLLAAAGFALAARRDARIELLPGAPPTVVIKSHGAPAAVFVLPALTLSEAYRVFGQPAPAERDRVLEQVLEEERELPTADVLLDQHRAYAWGQEDDPGAC